MKRALLLSAIALFAVGCTTRPIGGATGWKLYGAAGPQGVADPAAIAGQQGPMGPMGVGGAMGVQGETSIQPAAGPRLTENFRSLNRPVEVLAVRR
jgi:hypothetical protein